MQIIVKAYPVETTPENGWRRFVAGPFRYHLDVALEPRIPRWFARFLVRRALS